MGKRSVGSALALAVAMGTSIAAEASELRLDYGGWHYDVTGKVDDNGNVYDFRDDLDLHPEGRRSALIEWDTPRGWYPDLAASYSQIGASGSHQQTVPVFVGGVQVGTVTRTVISSAAFDDYDLALRYPWRWGFLRFTGGAVAKRLKGRVDIADTQQTQAIHETYDEVVPELQLGARWRLGKWLTLVGTGQGLEYQGNRAYEWRAAAEVRLLEPLLLELGYQQKRYDIDVDGYALNAKLGGSLLRIGFVLR